MNRLAIIGNHLPRHCGIATTSVALATGSISQLLDWLDRHGTDHALTN
jgi:hypothetical protein